MPPSALVKQIVWSSACGSPCALLRGGTVAGGGGAAVVGGAGGGGGGAVPGGLVAGGGSATGTGATGATGAGGCGGCVRCGSGPAATTRPGAGNGEDGGGVGGTCRSAVGVGVAGGTVVSGGGGIGRCCPPPACCVDCDAVARIPTASRPAAALAPAARTNRRNSASPRSRTLAARSMRGSVPRGRPVNLQIRADPHPAQRGHHEPLVHRRQVAV